MRLFLLLFIFLIQIDICIAQTQFHLQTGDLLFQDLACGTLCDGIGAVTYGVGNTYISHVGMVEQMPSKDPLIIEANRNGVIETPLSIFLARSHDKNNKPLVIVGRLNLPYRQFIPKAISYAKKQLGKPYNATFTPNTNQSFYCSQLIYDAFAVSNNKQGIFKQNHMNFNNTQSGKIIHTWQKYFAKLHTQPPQGQLGTNPGMMSRDTNIIIVYRYGKLKIHT